MEKLKTLKDLQTEEEMGCYFEEVNEFDVKRITRVVKGGIKKEAIKCKHCGSELPKLKAKKMSEMQSKI